MLLLIIGWLLLVWGALAFVGNMAALVTPPSGATMAYQLFDAVGAVMALVVTSLVPLAIGGACLVMHWWG